MRQRVSLGREGVSAAGAEREDGILFRSDRAAIARRWMEVPILQRRQALRIDVNAKALKHGLSCDFSTLVDRDFDNFVARRCRELPRINDRIIGGDGQSRANLLSIQLTPVQRSVGKSSPSAVTERRKGL